MSTTRRAVGVICSTLLLPVALLVLVTGLAADVLDLNEFVLHKYVGYAAAVLVLVHVFFSWPSLAAFWSGRRRPRPTPAKSVGRGADTPVVATRPPAGGVATPVPTENAGLAPSGAFPRRTVLAAAGAGAVGLATGWLIRPGPVNRELGEDLGALYHRASAPGLADPFDALVDWGGQPARTKSYPGAHRTQLPAETEPPELAVASAIGQRRSLRDYADRPLNVGELSWLLSAATGRSGDDGLRTAPSAGAQYPIETYVAISRVDGLEPGIYHYVPDHHALDLVRAGSFGGDLMLAALGQEFVRQAPIVVVLSAIFQRVRWRYRERGYRFALIEAGHIGQNLYLAAEAAGLGTCAVGSFVDDALNRLLGLDGADEAALMVLPVGPR